MGWGRGASIVTIWEEESEGGKKGVRGGVRLGRKEERGRGCLIVRAYVNLVHF
jgi:hypothetical protein